MDYIIAGIASLGLFVYLITRFSVRKNFKRRPRTKS